MNNVLPKFASAFKDRHGRERVRLRRTGWQTAYVSEVPGTAEFTQIYKEWLENGRIEAAEAKTVPGTFDDLISRFYQSAYFKDTKPQTQRIYRGELERFRATYGNRTVAGMNAKHVANLMTKMQATPSAANNLKKRLGQLFDFAILMGMRNDNPARVVRGVKSRTGGYQTWQEEHIAAFQARWPIGTQERLAFDLALYTGQRKSDVCRMGPQHVEKGRIRITQVKTSKELRIPIHPDLAKSIAATPSGHLAYIVTRLGVPRTRNGFGNWFGDACRASGLQGYSMHGLRKACARRLAELGLSNQLIKSITGHSSDAEVARYTRDAEQVRLADTAMGLATQYKTDLANRQEDVD
ncbi:tyrosine-type recombinase/integrase [Caenibius sp. WL]|uniref:tyrosine-type recombinase/integrase n=1 Tax=Caenibius sp. WL TaxID=2872646 RepID=UPI001C9906ED|nr:tyrosine-type recombinase/integrase [Caenibius sp. WL]QZP07811.1 tyrosine-type recombinase/integrase [Caenibius sp. WL]QZP09957.1 tyrosine-type recombinase/integrase [Caenibius sp. WL]